MPPPSRTRTHALCLQGAATGCVSTPTGSKSYHEVDDVVAQLVELLLKGQVGGVKAVAVPDVVGARATRTLHQGGAQLSQTLGRGEVQQSRVPAVGVLLRV